MHIVLLSFVLLWLQYQLLVICIIYCPIFLGVAELAMGQSFHFPSANVVTQKNMGIINWFKKVDAQNTRTYKCHT